MAMTIVDLLRNKDQYELMLKSTTLPAVLDALSRQATALGLTDTAWATRAGLRKETLSRLRRRQSCDFATLAALADVVGTRIGVLDLPLPAATPDGHFPASVSRDYEERLLDLCHSRSLDADRWAGLGPRFFMAGLAVMVASLPGHDRRGLLRLAERLHPGASETAVFAQWLERSPVRPARFVPLLEARVKHAA